MTQDQINQTRSNALVKSLTDQVSQYSLAIANLEAELAVKNARIAELEKPAEPAKV